MSILASRGKPWSSGIALSAARVCPGKDTQPKAGPDLREELEPRPAVQLREELEHRFTLTHTNPTHPAALPNFLNVL